MSDIKRRDNKGRVLMVGEAQLEDGSYIYRYTDPSGKRRKIMSWRLTKADPIPNGKRAKVPLREQEKEIQKKLYSGICDDGSTVCELVEKYLATKIPKATHNTIANYKTVQRLLEKEEFGHKKIQKIKYSDALSFLVGLQIRGKSYSSIQNIRGVLRPAFELAFRDELILSNPFSFQLGDALINDSVRREAISPGDERRFLDFVKNDKHFSRYYEGMYILFKTGLRISEFCGLTLHDIDFERYEITVDHQLQRKRNGTYIVVKPKTDAGVRVLPMKKDVEECFKKIIDNRSYMKKEIIVDGYGGFLFYDKNGKPMISMHWEKYFQHAVQKYNKIYKAQLPKITPHVCRHTYCTNMARSGISPKTLQYLMGHSDISITLNIYTHLGLEDAKKEINEIEKKENQKTKSKRNVSSKVVNL